MKKTIMSAAAALFVLASLSLPSGEAYAQELVNAADEASVVETETDLSALVAAADLEKTASELAALQRAEFEKAAAEAAREAIERAAEINKAAEIAATIASFPDHTYIDVNLTEQKLTYYINGGATLSTDIVTGNTSAHHDTPEGIYQIYGKQKSRTLRGADYEAYVNYWMPFVGNYGLHDATWRSSFGGDIYQRSGSHGCVNLPKSAAAVLYETAPVGTTVYIHS